MLADIHRLGLNYIPEYVYADKSNIVITSKPVRLTFVTPTLDNDQIQAVIDHWKIVKEFGDDLRLSWTTTTITIKGTLEHHCIKIKHKYKIKYILDGQYHYITLKRIKYKHPHNLD